MYSEEMHFSVNCQQKKLICKSSKMQSNLWKLNLFNFFMGFYMISGVLIPFYLTYGNLTFFQFMFLQSLYAIMVLIFEIPCGALADRTSRKYCLFVAGLSSSIGALIYGSMPNIFIFIIGDALFAFGTALMSGTNESMAFETLRFLDKKGNSSKVFSRIEASFLVGLIISAPLGSIIGFYFSLPLVMTLMFVPYILGTIISLTFHEPSEKNKIRKEKFGLTQTIKSGFQDFKRNRVLKKLIIEMLFIEIVITVLIYTYQLYLLNEFNTPTVYFGFISAGLTLSQLFFLNLFPKFELLTQNKRALLGISAFIPGIFYMLLAISLKEPFIILLIFIIIGMGSSRYILFINGINRQITEENRATMFSCINMTRVLFRSILLPLIGMITVANLQILFIFLGFTMILIALLSRVKKHEL